MEEALKSFFEKQAFGVCEKIGEKMELPSHRIRKYFIYLSFATFGSSIILYLILLFILENKEFFKRKRSTVWEL